MRRRWAVVLAPFDLPDDGIIGRFWTRRGAENCAGYMNAMIRPVYQVVRLP